MIRITLHRYKLNSHGRFGAFSLYDDDKLIYKCNSLEELIVGTKAGCDMAIPVGVYECDLHLSPSKKNGSKKYPNNLLIRVSNINVGKERYILIHIGNTLGDTLGCILLGVVDKDYTGVYNSTKTTQEFYDNLFNLCKKYKYELKQAQVIARLEITSELEDEIVCI